MTLYPSHQPISITSLWWVQKSLLSLPRALSFPRPSIWRLSDFINLGRIRKVRKSQTIQGNHKKILFKTKKNNRSLWFQTQPTKWTLQSIILQKNLVFLTKLKIFSQRWTVLIYNQVLNPGKRLTVVKRLFWRRMRDFHHKMEIIV